MTFAAEKDRIKKVHVLLSFALILIFYFVSKSLGGLVNSTQNINSQTFSDWKK